MQNNLVMAQRDMEKKSKKQKVVKVLVQVGLYSFLGIMALIVLFPFYWMIISSLKTLEEYRLSVPTLFPKFLDFKNYVEAFSTANLGKLFLNTMYVGIVSTLLSLVITVITAFVFARFAPAPPFSFLRFDSTFFLEVSFFLLSLSQVFFVH